jgi:hypothetical protein
LVTGPHFNSASNKAEQTTSSINKPQPPPPAPPPPPPPTPPTVDHPATTTQMHTSQRLLTCTILLLTCSTFPQLVQSRVRTREVSKRVPITHDTYLYLCSLNEQQNNEQNIVVNAYAALKTKAGSGFPLSGHVGPLGYGRDQDPVLISSKGCSYKSDFNYGFSAGPNTNYKQGVEMHYYVTTTNNEQVYLRIFRTLPTWNSTASLGHPIYDRGETTYYVYEALWKNSPTVNTNKETWVGQNLLEEPCTSPASIVGCSYKDIGELRQNDMDCTDCKFSLVYPTWNDYMPAYYPG